MRREPSLTFEGALRILGKHEPGLVGKLDTVLGGMILAAGAGAGLAAVGGPVLAPLGMFAAVWGFTEQKNEALGLLRKAINAVSGKMAGTQGYERRQLIAAAHTAIVVAAFFESFREHAGKKFYDQLEITDAEKNSLITRRWQSGETIYDVFYTGEIPAPSATRGYEENVIAVDTWYEDFSADMDGFLRGLSAAENASFDWTAIRDSALERYRSHFLVLAAKVPEFMIWALLGEGAATRTAVAGLRADIIAALDSQRDALGRVAALLSLDAARDGAMPDLRAAVGRANGGVLQQQIIPEGARGYGPEITFPATGEIYINPRYRLAKPDLPARLADDHWWDQQQSRDDFDLMLAGYVTSPDATRLPLLLLGHPGAGKSMLTKVFAARLPTTAYTVVRVPLRRVGANAPVRAQIEEALAQGTNGRVDSWWRLADQSRGTVRVVLLDGLDELLQATRNDRSGYLQDVVEFQRREAEQNEPVVVVVTSRTVVADRVDVPKGAAVVKLDAFDEPDIEQWLARWRAVNRAAISSGKMRELTADCVTGDASIEDQSGQGDRRLGGSVRELARQPLLLLMLAIYAADPALPPLDADMATADLYQRLLESFARREAAKDAGHDLHGEELDERVRDHLDRLEVAALAMFNRGRQDIGEEELSADLAALDPNPRMAARSSPAEMGQRVIGEFFFVHAAEARPLTGPSEPYADEAGMPSRREPPRRTYEFLHATFGEYFVATRIMSELTEVTARAFAGLRGPADPDDDLLYALLAHQPLAARKSTLTFAQEIFAGLRTKGRGQLLEVLEMLLGGYRHRHDSNRYTSYRPVPPDRVRELACYSANLVVLRVMLGGRVPLHKLLRIRDDDTLKQWRSTVTLWKAGLDADGLQSMLATVELSGSPLAVSVSLGGPSEVFSREDTRQLGIDDIALARLANDPHAEKRLRYGAAITDHYLYNYDNDAWVDQMASWLIPAIAGKRTGYIVPDPPEDTSPKDIAIVAGLIFRYFRSASADIERDTDLLRLLFKLPRVFQSDPMVLAALPLLGSKDIDAEFPAPEDEDIQAYGPYASLVQRYRQSGETQISDSGLADLMNTLSEEAANALVHVLKNWVKGTRSWDFGSLW
jgi:hypothetical protein